MAGYLFTVKDRQTGEILYQGWAKDCAGFLGCTTSYLRELARLQPEHKANTKYAKYKVERQACGEVKPGGAHKRDTICCDCGVLMVNVSTSRRRCPECSRIHDLKHKREKMRMMRSGGVCASLKIPKAKNNYCEGCIHFRGDFEINRCCNYYLDTGKRRPCAFGDGCTVKQGRKRYREKKERGTDIS